MSVPEVKIKVSRNNIIVDRLSSKPLESADLQGFSLLLQLDTTKSTKDFLAEFRQLKENYAIVKHLCQRNVGWFGLEALAYMLKTSDTRAARYRGIISQLKTGQQVNTKQSYFSTNETNKNSVCQKVGEIKRQYLAKTYQLDSHDLAVDKKNYSELEAFNDNLGFKPDFISRNICKLESNYSIAWERFIHLCPKYACLTQSSENNTALVNINSEQISAIKSEVLGKLNLTEDTQIFKNGTLNEEVGEKVIYRESSAATKIQSYFRAFSTDLRKQPADEYGYRARFYPPRRTTGDSTRLPQYITTANYKILPVPEKNPQMNAPKGTFKELIGKTKSTVLLQSISPAHSIRYTANQIEKVLLELGIASFYIPSHKINSENYLAVNAGDMDLNEPIKSRRSLNTAHFKEILKATKTLHKNGYYHLDIKPGNIQVTVRDNLVRLKVIDLDSFSSAKKTSNIRTKLYTSDALLKGRKELDREKRDFNLHINDTYSWIITLLESCGVLNESDLINFLSTKGRLICNYDSDDSPNSYILVVDNTISHKELRHADIVMKKILAFIKIYLKKEYHNYFLALLYGHQLYATTRKNRVHLYDMLI